MVGYWLRNRVWLAVGLAGLLLAAPSASAPVVAFDLSGRCGLVNVDSVYVQDGGRRGWYLHVGGMRRFANMDVGLDHRALEGGTLTLEVVGCTPNFIAFPVPTPYTLELPLRDVPGARRVRIIAANGTLLRRLPGR